MKIKLIIPFILMLCYATQSEAQRGPNYSDRYTYSSYGYDDRYDRNDRYYDRLNRQERKRLNKLLRRLEERERCAWEDGYVTRRERRRINEVREEIDILLYGGRYERRYERRRRRPIINITTPFCRW